MKTGGKVILVGAALVGLFYIPTLLAFKTLEFKPARLILRRVNLSTLTIEIVLLCTNKTGTPLTFQDVNLHVYFNRYHVANATPGIFTSIPGHTTAPLSVVVDIPYSDVLKSFWNSLLDGRLLEGQTIYIAGQVRVNNKSMRLKPIAFTSDYIINELSVS